ncbi:energy transducer TonB [Croceicoccus estronivorus]|uniref:TonB family protein n=1 Tax=Croceicoccus estronivorus TaxID=1172626 RepID=UPI000831BF66|nr:TonB family protein [Croceicoccus estronivorus]OCC22982.1 energy transducer TonB [Croceicoccus estronivorus]
MPADLDLKPPRRVRIGFILIIVLLHVAVIFGLIRAFAPDLASTAVNKALSVLTVTVTTPDPPEANAEPDPAPNEGASGAEGRNAKSRPVSAPKRTLPVKPEPVPPAASTGAENTSGARDAGEGAGAAGPGNGTGSGRSGSGQGGIAVRGVVKISGDINSARDYPKGTRERRIGHSVTILLTVGTSGRVTDCRVTQSSPDPEADAITCQLAVERFRFRPAIDALGDPVPGKYAWRQRWFY